MRYDLLTKDSVSVLLDDETRTSFTNTHRQRQELKNRVDKKTYNEIIKVWGKTPTIHDVNIAPTEQSILLNELSSIINWFRRTDYISLKVVRGNWSKDDERYLEYLSEYDMKKTRKDEIEEILGIEKSIPFII